MCDHENDKDIENLFNKIAADEKGQLDIMVNSAFKGGKVSSRLFTMSFFKIVFV